MRASMMKALLLGGLLLATAASAGQDEFGLGDGSDGPKPLSSGNNVVNTYAKVIGTPVVGGVTVVEVAASNVGTLFAQDDLVMVLQMGDVTPGSNTTADIALGPSPSSGIGQWELARVASVNTGSTKSLTLDRQLTGTYVANYSQVIKVPQYTTVTLTGSAVLTADAWDPVSRTGGVLAFLASQGVSVSGTGGINVDGKGFRGAVGEAGNTSTACSSTTPPGTSSTASRGEGVYFNAVGEGVDNLANGAGGGVCLNSGGGGGGNGGAGGRGGNSATTDGSRQVGGMGGARLTAALLSDRLTLGGGGGGGHGNATTNGGAGGAGGGILFMRAASLNTVMLISASGGKGDDGSAVGAGGGGAGGTVHIRLGGTAVCSSISARGGVGGKNTASPVLAPGGGGGGGRVFFQAESSTCSPSAVAGAAGNASDGTTNGATPTTAELSQYSGPVLVLPQKYERPAPPTVTSPAANAFIQASPLSISGTALPQSEVWLYVDSRPVEKVPADGSGQFTLSLAAGALGAGAHQVQAAAVYLGAIGEKSAAQTFTVDLTDPQLTLTRDTPARATTATFSFSSTEANVTFQCRLEPATYQPCSSPWSVAVTPDGPKTVRVKAVDRSLRETEQTLTWTVDSTPPNKPVISVPSQGAPVKVTSSMPLTLSGTAEAGATVSIYLDNSASPVAPTVTATGGNWTWSPSNTALQTPGSHVAVAVATDSAGNDSPPSLVRSFTIDTTPPTAPTVSSPLSNAYLKAEFTVKGSAEAGSTVTVQVRQGGSGGTLVTSNTGLVDAVGLWSVAIDVDGSTPASVTDGAYTLVVSVTDLAGFPNDPPNTTVPFTLDRAPPTVVFSVNPGARTRSTAAVFEFGTSPSETVAGFTCRLDSAPTFTACTSPYIVSAAEGSHTLRVIATDLAGNASAIASFPWTVDTTAPAAPSVTLPASNGPPVTTLLPTFTGTAEAGSTVTLYVDGVPLTTSPAVTTATGGTWSATPASNLTTGFHILTATATDDVGNVGPFSGGRTFVVDTTPPAAPQFTSPTDGAPVYTTTPTLRGTAEAGTTVNVSIDGTSIGTTTASAAGEWSLAVSTPLGQGTRSATATATDAASRTSAPTNPARTFVVDTVAPVAPTLTAPAALVGTGTPTVSGTAEANSKVNVFIDNALVGTTTAGSGAGNWSFVLPVALQDGDHTAQASATDAGGFEGPKSAGRIFKVDTTAPAIPTLTVPAANASLPTTQPAFGGKAEPLSTVTVRVDGNAVGTATTLASGDWNLPQSSGLSEAAHNVTVTATDAAGNTSQASAQVPFRVDLTAPGAPVISAPTDGRFVNSASPSVSGTAEPGSRVNLLVDGVDRGPVTADGSGNWSLTVPVALTDGPHTLRAQATDAAGNSNAGSLSAVRNITVDTVAPDTRIITGPDLVDVSSTARFVVRAQNADQSLDANTVAFDCSRDGGPFGECLETVVNPDSPGTFIVTLRNFEIGQDHLVLIRAHDSAGNTDETPATYRWRVVEGRLTVGIKFGPKDPTNITTADFIFESERPHAAFTGTLDGAPFNVASDVNAISFPGLADGQHTLVVQAVNPDNGAVSMESAQYVWTVDTAAPAPPGITVPGVGERIGTPTPTFRGTGEPGGTVEIFINNESVGPPKVVNSQGQWSYVMTSGLIEDQYTFTARMTDKAGTPSAVTPARTFFIDFTRPVVTADIAPPVSTNETTANFRFVVSETVSSYVCKLDNVTLSTCATSADPTVSIPVTEGPHTLSVTVTDLAGNANDPSFTYTWTVDRTAPTVTITAKPAEQTKEREATFAFQSLESPVTFLCSVDGSAFSEAGCPVAGRPPLQDLIDGQHVIRVQARDLAGNTSLQPAEYQWFVDTVAPAPPVLEAPTGESPVGEAKPTFKGTAEPNSTVSVLVDGATVASRFVSDASGHWEVPSEALLTEGTHTVRLVAKDRAGNDSPLSDPVEFRLDTTGPDTEITSGPDKRLRSVTATFTFASEEGAQFECSLDRGAFVGCPADGTFTGLEEGGHSLEVRAFDVAGNRDPSPATYSWRVYLGNDIRTRGGGLSCAATDGGGGAPLALLGLGGLVLLGSRRRRRA